MKRTSRLVLLLLISPLIATIAGGDLIELDEVLSRVQRERTKIKDMYAETTTKITSNLRLTTDNQSKAQTMVQKGKMWTKGEDRSKIELLSPTRQITITNGGKVAIIDPATGRRIVRERDQGLEGSRDQGLMDLEKAKDYFDLSVRNLETLKPGDLETYVIVGVPKKKNKFLGKMEFIIDSQKWSPVRILMYDAGGKLISRSEIEYQRWTIDEGQETIWVPAKTVSDVTTPLGTMRVEMELKNARVNEGISEAEFRVE